MIKFIIDSKFYLSGVNLSLWEFSSVMKMLNWIKIDYGNEDEYGLGIVNLYHYQGTKRVVPLTKHVDQDNITGKLLMTSIEAAKVEIGSTNPFVFRKLMLKSFIIQ